MRLFVSVLIVVKTTILCNSAIAEENFNDSQWATSIGIGSVFLRKHFHSSQSIYFGARYSLYKRRGPSSNNSTSRSYSAVIGYRYYIDESTIHNYLDSSFSFDSSSVSENRYYGLVFMYGLEKFISKKFSVEGSAGFSLRYSNFEWDENALSVSIPVTRVAINYYF